MSIKVYSIGYSCSVLRGSVNLQQIQILSRSHLWVRIFFKIYFTSLCFNEFFSVDWKHHQSRLTKCGFAKCVVSINGKCVVVQGDRWHQTSGPARGMATRRAKLLTSYLEPNLKSYTEMKH